ncbi:hypothetical protein [Streptomyces sp. CC208A]|uniref:hypothetical protein n=1 Tax=Streptomyces sp. CC208A TaxID=3044573 RepID=UPI0024A92228|nr:hypothetical protein [Streptomyces sp. CC208A]
MSDTDIDTSTSSLVRTDRFAQWAGIAAGAFGGLAVARADTLGVGLLCAPTVLGLGAVAGVLAGDALTPRPGGAVRTAGLAPRRVRDQVPRRLTPLLLGLGGLLVVLLAVAAAIASPDDMGRAGRALSVACPDGTQTAGPWPGLYYGLPAALALAAATLVCVVALRHVTRRPGEADLRRSRASAIVAAWGLLVAGTLTGTALTAARSLNSLSCDGALGTVGAALLYPTALTALCTALWCLCTLLVADRR